VKRRRYFHSHLSSQIVSVPEGAPPEGKDKPSRPLSHYIAWSELLRRTFQIARSVLPALPLRLIARIKTDEIIKKVLSALGLPTDAPKLSPERPPPSESGGAGGDGLN
jgi:hypothetical protein